MLTVKCSAQEGKEKKASIYPPKPRHIQQAGGSPLKQSKGTIPGIRHTQRFFWQERLMNCQGEEARVTELASELACLMAHTFLARQKRTNKKNLSIRLAEVSRVQTLRRTRSKGRILPPLATNGSGYSAASLTRCCRTCLSSGYYEFTSYTIDHPESSHYARNMEILQRMNNCEPGNAKNTEVILTLQVHLAPHLIFNTAPRDKHPQSRANTVSPFLAISSQFPVPSDHIKLSSHNQCSQMPLWCRLLPNLLILWQ